MVVKQGSVEEELVLPADTLFSGFGAVFGAWEHRSKFKLTADGAANVVVSIDGMDHQWDSLADIEDLTFEQATAGAESIVLELPAPPQPLPVPVVEQTVFVPVVDALDESMAPFATTNSVTVAEIKELLLTAYDGDAADACLVQLRGVNGTSFQSIKLAAFTDPSAVLLETIASRLSKTPQMLRPPVPSELSELRIKLAMGMKPKAPAAQQETTFASETKAKVLAPSPSPLAPHPALALPHPLNLTPCGRSWEPWHACKIRWA